MSASEQYWNLRALAETKAALACDDPHLASLHVDLATRCVRKALDERQRIEEDSGIPVSRGTDERRAAVGQGLNSQLPVTPTG